MYAKGEGVARDIEHAKRHFDEAEYMGLDVSQMRASVGL
jgi:TPR repeat protein